ncbi:hypothetical protein MVEN_01991800 [Mycena venus]|uniref:Uncharacterized protein n=1 Tax=Mycena venus TaxID=2733690 RepID=A0A8H6XEB7_9AGAR|nr:hypothetical protein MVEN_01991800 [Mycena venus]
MSGKPTSFGGTISSGIQDLSAILSLFGTAECELHVGSALRGGGRGGYLYAAITPLSIFGSLGPAKAAFSIMLLCLPRVGARTLDHMGFEAKGDVMALAMLEGNRYKAERLLVELLDKHYIRSARNVRIERPEIHRPHFLLRPWNFKLLLASLLVACLGVTPYIHFAVLKHTSFFALAVFFPLCRVLGGLFCVFPGQLLLQYRIEMIVKQRVLFMGINDLSGQGGRPLNVPTRHIRLWDASYTSEACLSSLYNFLETPAAGSPNAAPFLKHLAQVLPLNLDSPPTPKDVAMGLKPYVTNTWPWLAMMGAILSGFFMTLVGYIGCFTIVQNSRTALDTYIWLVAEATLALIRLLVWASNPPWDESDGLQFRLHCPKNQSLQGILGTEEFPADTFQMVTEKRFWEALTAYSGPVNLDRINTVSGFRHLYSSVLQESGSGSAEILCLILEGEEETILCTMNEAQELAFHHADMNPTAGHTVRRKPLEMKGPSEFMMDVFEHYHFILSRVDGKSDPIRVSWPLSESFLVDSEVHDECVGSGDLEKATEERWGRTPKCH